MGIRLAIVITVISVCHIIPVTNAQGQSGSDSSALNFKLDYNVPESPGFSILDANPTTVMRASAAQEVIVNMANTLLSGNNLEPGIALDFNPYFVFGGRLKNINEYKNKYGKRLLGNIQLSMATNSLDAFPDDLFVSSGVRITLFDSKDPLFDNQLINDIGDALIPVVFDDEKIQSDCESYFAMGQVNSVASCVSDIKTQQNETARASSSYKDRVKKAYADSKKRLKSQSGGAVSVGYAIAGRMRNSSFEADSISTYRHQAWLSAQYDFGEGMTLSSIFMYRYNALNMTADRDEFVTGLALRHMGRQTNLLGELTWSSLGGGLDFRANLEVRIIPKVILYLSAGNESDTLNKLSDKFVIRPGFKWNLSELGI